jgi:DNA helicase II / ATP-dependent DNA helicase PcrA
MSLKINIVLGPPGTGKTTKLLSIVDGWLQSGIKSQEICFVSFTKKAASEATNRARDKFNLLSDDLPYFRTLHSLAFLQLGLRSDQAMSTTAWFEFARIMGISITLKSSTIYEEGSASGFQKGDRLLFFENLARVKCMRLEDLWDASYEESISLQELQQVRDALKNFKEQTGRLDYTDMICEFTAQNRVPSIKKLVVDEAQDLSRCQWHMVGALAKMADEVYIAGDDDQAIFQWAGADIETWINLPGRVQILDQSYRVPSKVASLANEVISRVSHRRKKIWHPRDEKGLVSYIPGVEILDLDKGQWLLLARNQSMLKAYEDYCDLQGLLYESPRNKESKGPIYDSIRIWMRLREGRTISAAEAEYVYGYMSLAHGVLYGSKGMIKALAAVKPNTALTEADLRRDYGLKATGTWDQALDRISFEDRRYFLTALKKDEVPGKMARIRISTIHGAKGGEADNVVIMTDMAVRTYREYQENPDDEHRVWYVGVTRAKQNLYIINPQTLRHYDL